MSEVINLANNIISKDDREQLESFGGHTIAHGRATRWHWARADNRDNVFNIYRGGAEEVLTVCISRDRKMDAFYAHDTTGNMVASGELDHVMAELENYFIQLHGEGSGSTA